MLTAVLQNEIVPPVHHGTNNHQAPVTSLLFDNPVVRPRATKSPRRQCRWQRSLLISLRHNADVLPGGPQGGPPRRLAQGGGD